MIELAGAYGRIDGFDTNTLLGMRIVVGRE